MEAAGWCFKALWVSVGRAHNAHSCCSPCRPGWPSGPLDVCGQQPGWQFDHDGLCGLSRQADQLCHGQGAFVGAGQSQERWGPPQVPCPGPGAEPGALGSPPMPGRCAAIGRRQAAPSRCGWSVGWVVPPGSWQEVPSCLLPGAEDLRPSLVLMRAQNRYRVQTGPLCIWVSFPRGIVTFPLPRWCACSRWRA